MQKKITISGLLISVVFSFTLRGQIYDMGQDPFSVKWKQINTTYYQLVFAEEIAEEAKKLASILDYVYFDVCHSLAHVPPKISILLHNHTVESNGFVTWAPKRMEAFVTPPQDIYSQDWLEQIAIHELRHVVQIDKLNQGFTSLLSILFGEQAVGAVAGMIPPWLYEGDAVCTETALGTAGRGRQPAFEKEIRAISLSQKRIYSYEKAIFGSYKNYIPDHYQYGYLMTAYGRNRYDSALWANIYRYVGRKSFVVAPMYFGMKKYAGEGKRKLYKNSMFFMKEQWLEQDNKTIPSSFTVCNNPNKRCYTSYRLPQVIDNRFIVAEKSGIDHIKEYVLLDSTGKETRLLKPGFHFSDQLSANGNLLVWNERIPDIRWAHRSYYVIKSYDFHTGKEKILTPKSRYFAPVLNHGATQIAAVETDISNRCRLLILDALSGEILQTVAIPANNYIQLPSWSNDNSSIVATMVSDGGKSIVRYIFEKQRWDTIFGPSYDDFSHPVFYKQFILFRAAFSGIDNIYALHTGTKTIYQVTSSKYGAYYPCVDANRGVLYYENYSSLGYDIAKIHLDSNTWKEFSQVENHSYKLYEKLLSQERKTIYSSDIPKKDYHVQKYNRLSNVFNLHSWAPSYIDYDETDFDGNYSGPGLTFLSQNLLGNTFLIMGYKMDNGAHYFIPKIVYKSFFPVLAFNAIYQPKAQYGTGTNGYSTDYTNVNSRVYVPLNYTRNHFVRSLIPSLTFQLVDSSHYMQGRRTANTNYYYLNYEVSVGSYEKMSHRDIVPRLGQQVKLNYITTLPGNRLSGKVLSAWSTLFLPGLPFHHAFKIQAGHYRNYEDLYFSPINMPRGFRYRVYAQTFSAVYMNYIFPVCYPDINIGSFLYVKRLRANFFHDYAMPRRGFFRNNYNDFTFIRGDLHTSGYELSMDIHLFHMIFPIQAGIRMNYLHQTGEWMLEAIFEVNIDNF